MTTVSCIVPVRNEEKWLPECLDSILLLETSCNTYLQVSVYNDGSTDDTGKIIEKYRDSFFRNGIDYLVSYSTVSHGVGYAKNRAVKQSTGDFLCFCDADDVFLPCRILCQLDAALHSDCLSSVFVGGKFERIPEGSTLRFAKWANSLIPSQLRSQMYTSHGPTLVAPTWFISRKLYDAVGGFNESYAVGYPEDLEFFFSAVRLGAKLVRVDECVTLYRYHSNCASLSVNESKIWSLRVDELSKNVLSKWTKFTIWNAGKQGKRFFRSLQQKHKEKVVAFCDVDFKKIQRGYFEYFDPDIRKIVAKIPIITVSAAVPPVIICVKMGLTSGVFEKLLAQRNWREGVDYFHFN